MIITRFTDYTLQTPHWFIRYIRDEFSLRDIEGLFGGKNLKVPNVSGVHPLVRLTGQIIAGSKFEEVSSILPAISVTIDPEVDEVVTKGYGLRTPMTLDQAWVDEIRANMPMAQNIKGADIAIRQRDAMLTDGQLALIEDTIRAKGAPIVADKLSVDARETVYVSLWAHTIDERDALWYVLRSILSTMKSDASQVGMRDFGPMNTPRGLVNMNFGRLLHGQETRFDYLNTYNTYTVTDRIDKEIDVSVEWLLKSTRPGDGTIEHCADE